MIEELNETARKLEHQLVTYEKLHAEELRKFQERFAAFQRVQSDEFEMLRAELAELKMEIAQLEAKLEQGADLTPAEPSPPKVDLTISRRDFLSGNLKPYKKRAS